MRRTDHPGRRAHTETIEQASIVFDVGIAGGQQFLAVENRVCTGEKRERLQLISHLFATRRQSDCGARHQDSRHRDSPNEIERIDRRLISQRRAGYSDELVDGDAFWVLFEIGKHLQHAGAITHGFTHADDATTAHIHPRFTHRFQRFEAILEIARSNDLVVVLG